VSTLTTGGWRVLIYDKTQTSWSEKFLTFWWAAGQAIGNFDTVIPAATWDEAYEGLANLPPVTLAQVQLWAHGAPARPLIDGKGPSLAALFSALDRRAGPGTVLWWRACNVFQGRRGQAFAQDLVARGVRTVGHTRVISAPWVTHQSGGYGLRPGELPHWSDQDAGGSTPWQPNTCLVTRMTPPDTWFQAE
jgi:hypothetical protein